MSASFKKFIALFDIHIGWERRYERGKLVTREAFNRKALMGVVNFASEFSPDILVLGGDQLNCGPISHWHQGRPILDEGLRLRDEYDTLDELVLEPFKKVPRKIWLFGNHEMWIESHVASNPGLEGLIMPENYLDLSKYEIYSQGEVASIGKLNFVHGDVVLGRGSYTNPAKRLVDAYRRNIRAGHLHTYSAAVAQTAVDAKDYHSGIVVLSLSTLNPAFIKNNPNQFMNGFLYGYVAPDGSFTDFVTIINNGNFVINGKKY